MTTLIDHATRELDLIGEDPDTKAGVLRVVQAFADMGHSGSSAAACSHYLDRLLRYQPLTPLTNAPGEWTHIAEDTAGQPALWQSARNPEAFSNDGGKTYYLLSEVDGFIADGVHPVHTAVSR